MTDGTHSHTEKLPFETKVEVNPDLKKGEWRYKTIDGVEQKGKLGSRTTEWTIKNSEVQAEPKVTEDKAVNAIIEVGSADFEGEVKHTEHFEIPFEVEIRYNDDLPAGTSKEIQKGVKGSYDVEYKQNIKNGQADGEMTKTESNRKDYVKHIIEVGRKVETPENNYSKDVEVEIEYVYDDTKDKGVVETGELSPGKVETKVVDKYNPETGKVEQTTEEVVTKAKQKVIVGTKDFTGIYEYKKTCPIPFEVEIIEDAKLSKGERVVDQEGKAGSKTTSYEQDIKNGKAEGEARQTSEEVTEKPTKHIVRVGTKSLTGNRENVVIKDRPYKTEVIYDDTLDAGTRVVENEGKDGKERVTTTITSKDGDISVDSQAEVIEKEENRLVRVGIKPVEKVEEIPFETEYEYDENLDAGKTVISQEGSKGRAIITTSFNKETGKLETEVERTEPIKRIIKIGTKPNDNMCPVPEDPKTPDQPEDQRPGHEDSYNPSPEEPEDPSNPKTPEDKPSRPGDETPNGEDPSDPGQPGSEESGTLGEENPSDSQTSGSEDPNQEGAEESIEASKNEGPNKQTGSEPNRRSDVPYRDSDLIPKTGDESRQGLWLGLSSLSLAGLLAAVKKYFEEE